MILIGLLQLLIIHVLGDTAAAGPANDCLFEGNKYSHGAVVAQPHHHMRCVSGQWDTAFVAPANSDCGTYCAELFSSCLQMCGINPTPDCYTKCTDNYKTCLARCAPPTSVSHGTAPANSDCGKVCAELFSACLNMCSINPNSACYAKCTDYYKTCTARCAPPTSASHGTAPANSDCGKACADLYSACLNMCANNPTSACYDGCTTNYNKCTARCAPPTSASHGSTPNTGAYVYSSNADLDSSDMGDDSRALQMEGIPVYGNWCGPGYGSGTPRDGVDTCCMNHDHCYDKDGSHQCGCDRDLVDCVSGEITKPGTSAEARTAAIAVQVAFGIAPCQCRVCVNVPGFCHGRPCMKRVCKWTPFPNNKVAPC